MARSTLPLMASVGFAAKFMPHYLLDPATVATALRQAELLRRDGLEAPGRAADCQTAARCIVGRSAIFFIAGLRPAPASALASARAAR